MKKLTKNKKGQQAQTAIATLLTLGIGIMVLGIALAFGLDITGDLKADFVTDTAGCNATDVTSCGLEYNATNDAQLGMSNITSQTPTIAKVGVAVVIIGMIVAGFGVYFMRN